MNLIAAVNCSKQLILMFDVTINALSVIMNMHTSLFVAGIAWKDKQIGCSITISTRAHIYFLVIYKMIILFNYHFIIIKIYYKNERKWLYLLIQVITVDTGEFTKTFGRCRLSCLFVTLYYHSAYKQLRRHLPNTFREFACTETHKLLYVPLNQNLTQSS